ncbi:hypothetical protein ACVBAX_12840 [Robertmurraya sp. GLU-23]
MKTDNNNPFQNHEITTENEVSMRKLLNVIGIFIFGGLVLTNFTTPLPSYESTKEYLVFIAGITFIYYLLVNIYFKGGLGKK